MIPNDTYRRSFLPWNLLKNSFNRQGASSISRFLLQRIRLSLQIRTNDLDLGVDGEEGKFEPNLVIANEGVSL